LGEGVFPGVKLQGREAHHSPASSAEVKNCGTVLLFICDFIWLLVSAVSSTLMGSYVFAVS
jgi:hypothetical protein